MTLLGLNLFLYKTFWANVTDRLKFVLKRDKDQKLENQTTYSKCLQSVQVPILDNPKVSDLQRSRFSTQT